MRAERADRMADAEKTYTAAEVRAIIATVAIASFNRGCRSTADELQGRGSRFKQPRRLTLVVDMRRKCNVPPRTS